MGTCTPLRESFYVWQGGGGQLGSAPHKDLNRALLMAGSRPAGERGAMGMTCAPLPGKEVLASIPTWRQIVCFRVPGVLEEAVESAVRIFGTVFESMQVGVGLRGHGTPFDLLLKMLTTRRELWTEKVFLLLYLSGYVPAVRESLRADPDFERVLSMFCDATNNKSAMRALLLGLQDPRKEEARQHACEADEEPRGDHHVAASSEPGVAHPRPLSSYLSQSPWLRTVWAVNPMLPSTALIEEAFFQNFELVDTRAPAQAFRSHSKKRKAEGGPDQPHGRHPPGSHPHEAGVDGGVGAGADARHPKRSVWDPIQFHSVLDADVARAVQPCPPMPWMFAPGRVGSAAFLAPFPASLPLSSLSQLVARIPECIDIVSVASCLRQADTGTGETPHRHAGKQGVLTLRSARPEDTIFPSLAAFVECFVMHVMTSLDVAQTSFV